MYNSLDWKTNKFKRQTNNFGGWQELRSEVKILSTHNNAQWNKFTVLDAGIRIVRFLTRNCYEGNGSF